MRKIQSLIVSRNCRERNAGQANYFVTAGWRSLWHDGERDPGSRAQLKPLRGVAPVDRDGDESGAVRVADYLARRDFAERRGDLPRHRSDPEE